MTGSRAIEASSTPLLLIDRPTRRTTVLTLNRPHVHNALDRWLIEQLQQGLESAANDPDCGAIILTGAGRSFCSGDDLKALRSDSYARFAETIESLQALTAWLFTCPKPVVAALNGPAYGAGLEVVLACDVRVAAESFVGATPEVRLGLVPTNGASLLLPLLIGHSRARAMMMGGTIKDANWCLAAGLIDEIASSESLMQRAVQIADDMAAGAPGAIAATRRMMNAPLQAALVAALELEASSCIEARRTPECAKRIDAYFARRSTEWIPE